MVIVVGPTGSGKSDLAIEVSKEIDGEVVNCDSIQIYRHFNIGAAKLPPAQQRGIPHHLVDIADPDQVFTAGDYARAARAVLQSIVARAKVPVVTGGTGFYLRALLDGLFEGPPRNQALRDRLSPAERARPGLLHRLLRRIDPAAAARIHPNDVNKLIRAVEIIAGARRPLTAAWEQGRQRLGGFRTLKIGLNPPRSLLYERLNQRSRRMFDLGLMDEVRAILDMGYPASAKPFASLGYLQALRCLKGECTLEQAVADTEIKTRQYAKRQWTWFRSDPEVQWVDGLGDESRVRDLVVEKVRRFLQ